MPLSKLFRWIRSGKRQPIINLSRVIPTLHRLESRDVPAGYYAGGAGPGGLPAVTIRVDIQDAIGGQFPSPLGGPAAPRSDGKTDTIAQQFFPFATSFRGGVKVATGNFDGAYGTPDSLVTAAGPGGGPHVIVWNMREDASGRIVTNGIRDQFYAYDARFRGGVSVATGDLDGDGRAELITGAGPGGGPHVRVWKEINGRFQVVNEFFAFDAGFRGGVNVASGQGYRTVREGRVVLNDDFPDGFRVTTYVGASASQNPETVTGIPLAGYDVPVAPGGNVGYGPGAGYTVPLGIEGHEFPDSMPVPYRPYFTVSGGGVQYLSGNFLNQYGNDAYRPTILNTTNDTPRGRLVYAQWSDTPPPGFVIDVPYGPFIQLDDGTGDTAIVTRLTVAPGTVTFRNFLVIGAGPGGGPHVKVFDFAAVAGNGIQNLGVGKEFFAFDSGFRGGVSVAVGDVLMHTDSSTLQPSRIDYTQDPPRLIVDTNQNSGTQAFLNRPLIDTSLYRRYQPEIITGMQTLGSEIRTFADLNPPTTDPFNAFSNLAPSRRTSLSQINPTAFINDLTTVVNPNNPLGGYYGFSFTGSFRRGVDNAANYTGGVNVAVSAFNFIGSDETRYYGYNNQGNPTGVGAIGGSPIATNPVLGQLMVAANGSAGQSANRGSRVRIFNQMGPYVPTQNEYNAYDDFQAFPADSNVQGSSIAFGLGSLPEPDLQVTYENHLAGANGAANGGALDFFTPEMVSDPILV